MKVFWQPGIIVDWNEGNLEFMHWILNELSLAHHWVVVVVSTQWANESSWKFTQAFGKVLGHNSNLIIYFDCFDK